MGGGEGLSVQLTRVLDERIPCAIELKFLKYFIEIINYNWVQNYPIMPSNKYKICFNVSIYPTILILSEC